MKTHKSCSKNRIGFLLPTKEKYSSFYGGAVARWVFEVISRGQLDKCNFEVFALSCNTDHAYLTQSLERSTKLYNTFIKQFESLFRGDKEGFLWVLFNIHKIKKCCVIIIENRPHYGIFIRKLGYKGKIVVHMHNDFFSTYNPSYLGYLERNIDYIIGCSSYILQPLKFKCNALFKKSFVLYNGVNEDLFCNDGRTQNRKEILYVGRLDEGKGVVNLIRAFKKGHHSWKGWKLIIAGSSNFGGDISMSPYERRLRDMVAAEGLEEKVHFLGYVDHDKKLPALLKSASLLCLPSIVPEAFPLVIIEAMIARTPVVCTKIGGIPEALGEDYPFFAEPNTDSLYNSLDRVISNYSSAISQSDKLANQAMENFTWNKVAIDFSRFLTQSVIPNTDEQVEYTKDKNF